MIISFALAKALHLLSALATAGSGVYFFKGLFAEKSPKNDAWVPYHCAKRYYTAYVLQTVALISRFVAEYVA